MSGKEKMKRKALTLYKLLILVLLAPHSTAEKFQLSNMVGGIEEGVR